MKSIPSHRICSLCKDYLLEFIPSLVKNNRKDFNVLYTDKLKYFPGGFRSTSSIPPELIINKVRHDILSDNNIASAFLNLWYNLQEEKFRINIKQFLKQKGYIIYKPDFSNSIFPFNTLNKPEQYTVEEPTRNAVEDVVETHELFFVNYKTSDSKDHLTRNTLLSCLYGWFPIDAHEDFAEREINDLFETEEINLITEDRSLSAILSDIDRLSHDYTIKQHETIAILNYLNDEIKKNAIPLTVEDFNIQISLLNNIVKDTTVPLKVE